MKNNKNKKKPFWTINWEKQEIILVDFFLLKKKFQANKSYLKYFKGKSSNEDKK